MVGIGRIITLVKRAFREALWWQYPVALRKVVLLCASCGWEVVQPIGLRFEGAWTPMTSHVSYRILSIEAWIFYPHFSWRNHSILVGFQ